jgi:hypothetical protein
MGGEGRKGVKRRVQKRKGHERSEEDGGRGGRKGEESGGQDGVDDYSPTNSYKGFVLPAFLQQAV